jgi:serine protease Do
MSRPNPPLLVVATLVLGVLLGVLLDRGGPFLSAQATATARPSATPAPAPAVNTPSSVNEPQVKASGDDSLYAELDRQYEQFQQINRTFELVARAVSPSVVHIVAHKTTRSKENTRIRHFDETGSGVIVRSDRVPGRLFVLTNNHVIEKSKESEIDIVLQDGQVLHPEWYRADLKADIAVLALSRNDLPAARFGNSNDASVGSWVLAMGSPFGLMHSVSQGIISAKGRHMEELQDVENQDFLQTDAAINPGNSGGPLVNMRGEIIGINNSIASNGGGNEGVGFSIPINLARWIMNQLVTNGHVSRGALGIVLHIEFRSEDAQKLGLKRPRGAWIDVVSPASPAEAGGLRGDDVILRFNGAEIQDLNHLINIVSMAPIGKPAEVVVWRDRKALTLQVTVGDKDRTVAQLPTGERPASGGLLRRGDRPASSSSFALGLELSTFDEDTARRLNLPTALRGAFVLKIAPDSPLSTRLMPNDVISTVNGRSIASAEDAVRALNQQENLVVEFDRLVKGAIERRTARLP